MACEHHVIRSICFSLKKFTKLSETCIKNYIKLIEELSKLSILPVELKGIFRLLRNQSDFPFCKEMLRVSFAV